MSTYSLNLRSELNRRLTINEMDGNFLYLEELALSVSTGVTGPTGVAGTGSNSGFDQDLNTFNDVLFSSVSVKGDINIAGSASGYINTINTEDTYTWLQGVAVDDLGYQYVSGGTDNDTNFVSKISPTGEYIWSVELVAIGLSPSITTHLSSIIYKDNYVFTISQWDINFTIFKLSYEDGSIVQTWTFTDENGFEINNLIINDDLEPIVIGGKSNEFIVSATVSNTLTGSTVSTIILDKSNFDSFGKYPSNEAWQISGDGFSDWTYVNQNNTNKILNLPTTTISGSGSNLRVNIVYQLNTLTYDSIEIYSQGSGYVTGDLLLVKGSLLEGVDGATYSATIFNNSGQSLYFEVSSYPDLDQIVQNGWRISGTGITGYGTVSNLQNTGALWRVDIGQTVTLNSGDTFIFDNNGGNDATFEIGYADNSQVYWLGNLRGVSTIDYVIFNFSQGVDFSQPGNWSFRISTSNQGFIWTPNWTKSIGELSSEYTNSASIDSLGNIYLGVYYVQDNKNALVIKLDTNGDIVWNKYFDDELEYNYIHSINCDDDNNIVLTSMNDDDYIVVTKITPDGVIIWQKSMQNQNSWDNLTRTTIDENNNIIITGSYYVLNQTYDILIIKLDTNGNVIWGRTIGTYRDEYDFWNFDSDVIRTKNDILYRVAYGYTDQYSNGILISLNLDGIGIGEYDGWDYKDFSVEFSSTQTTSPTDGDNRIIDIELNSINLDFLSNDILGQNTLTTIRITNDNNILNTKSIEFSDGSILRSSLIKQNQQGSYDDYTLRLTDINCHIYRTDGDGYGIIIPTNSSVPFKIGSAITIVSGDSNLYFHLEDSGVTEVWGAGYNQTSNYWYIPYNSMATLLKIGTDKWMLSGAGLDID